MELKWEKLLCSTRSKDLHGAQGKPIDTAAGRLELERDYDRILFATPTRRMADKTQVFPMEENDSVRTRLTHSLEVSNLARSIGIKIAFEHAEAVFGANHEQLAVKRAVPALLAAVGLAHDLGNPPFGHQGEYAMQQWFRKWSDKHVEEDFKEFDGNAQTFRLLTKLQVVKDQFGLNLTMATLASLLKYPSVYGTGNKFGYKKYGVFQSEKDTAAQVWEQTGLAAGIRHPLAYVMEACDDIAYSIIDAEDTVKKGYASFYDLMDFLETEGRGDQIVGRIVKESREQNADVKGSGLSSSELNDVSMQMFRVKAISEMVSAATDVFVSNIDSLMRGDASPGFELIKESRCAALCKAAKNFDRRFGFIHKDVLRLELMGSNYINGMMDVLWRGIKNEEDSSDPFERYVFRGISENYRRVYVQAGRSPYARFQLLCDAVSGMTESYLVKKYDGYKELEKASV